MRILLHDASRDWTGGARAFFAAGGALAARGYDVSFACPAGSSLALAAQGGGLATILIGSRAELWSRALVLRRAIQEHFVDVIFVHGEEDDLAASLAIRTTGRGALVRRTAAGERLVVGWRTRAARRLAPAIYLLTAPSPDDVGAGNGERSIRGELGVAIPPPRRDDGAVVGGRGTPRLACLASRAAYPRVLNVFRAVALLAERHPRVRLTVGGSAASLEVLRLGAAALNIGRSVEFLKTGDERDALRSAEAAWVVADGDEAGFACLQVMAHGLPVLTERTAVNEHFVVHDVHGALFPALEPPAMAATIAVLTAKPTRREEIGRTAKSRVLNEFTEREMANGFEQATRAAREHMRSRA